VGAARPKGKKEVRMSKMEFAVGCVRECLLRQGRVFTVRSYLVEGRFGRIVAVDGIGLCWRELVGQVNCKDDLAKFVEFSGFTSVDDWWNKVVQFCGSKDKWLYKVCVYRNGRH
jgi:hypothetical protein